MIRKWWVRLWPMMGSAPKKLMTALHIEGRQCTVVQPQVSPLIRFPENDGDSGCRQTEVDGRVRRSEKRQAFSGTVLLGAKYRFITPGEDDWFPQVAFYPAVLVPTGNQKFGFSSGHVQYFLPLWLQKDFGPWTVYGGGGYWINPGAGNKNYGFTGVAVWRKIGEQLNIGA